MDYEALLAKIAAAEAGKAAAEAGRAAAEAGWAAAEAGRAAAETRLAASLGALALGPPAAAGPADAAVAAAAAAAAAAGAPVPAALTFPSIPKKSPTAPNAKCFFSDPFVALVGAPVSMPVDASLQPTFERLLSAAGGARGMGSEPCFYRLATSCLPTFAEAVGEPGGDMTAAALFSASAMRTRVWTFPGCKPELHLRAAAGRAGQPALCPGFNGEVKSTASDRALEQAAFYATMDMVRVFFPAPPAGADTAAALAAAAAKKRRLFYALPPTAFALVALPHVAYYLALEWVGKVLVSPVSQPFFLGSPQHAAAAGALHQHPYTAPVALEVQAAGPLWLTAPGDKREVSAWCVDGDTFRKLVRGDARSGEGFAALHAAYAVLAEALPRAPPSLRLPSSARLLYGEHEVLVEMPAVAGAARRAATEGELGAEGGDGRLLPAVARAVAWLARQRLVYTDLRAPNVLVDGEGQPWLVDFDDCAVAPAPVTSLQGYLDAVAACPGAQQADTFAASLCAGGEAAVVEALRCAFEEGGAEQGGGGGGGGE